MIKIDTKTPVSDERIDVFSIDDETYSMPKEINGQFAMQVLDQIRAEGSEATTAFILKECIGSKGYRALMDCQTLTTGDLKAVIKIVSDHVLGAVEDVAGK